MPARLCKVCSYKLQDNDYYFCSNCGSVLESPLVLKPQLKDQTIEDLEFDSSNYFLIHFLRIFNSYYFLLILLFVTFLVTFLTIKNNYIFVNNKQTSKNTSVVSYKDSCSIVFLCDDFNRANISNLVPHDVSFYLEAFDFNKLSKLLLSYEPKYYDLLEKLTYLEPTDLAVFIQDYNNNRYYTVILYSEKSPNDSIINLLTENNDLVIEKLDNYYILSTKKDIMIDIRRTKEKLNKNISDSSVYAIATNINNRGQLLIIDNLDDTNFYQRILNNSIFTADVKNIFNKLIENKQNYIVL